MLSIFFLGNTQFLQLEKEMATHSSVLAWRILGMGSHRVGDDWSDLAVAVAAPIATNAANPHLNSFNNAPTKKTSFAKLLCAPSFTVAPWIP